MKKISLGKAERRLYSTLVVGAVLLFAVLGLLLHVQALSTQIATLEKQQSDLTSKVALYERSLCSNNPNSRVTQANALTKYNLVSAGHSRSYQVHTPNNYDPSVRYPVVLSFDGIEGSGSRMEAYSGLDRLPAVIVYPDAMVGKRGFTAWQGAPYSLDGNLDIQFVRTILDTLPSQYCVDSTRTFAVGMSNGGAFAATVGCELGSEIKAVASVSGAYYKDCETGQHTPSLLVVHSRADGQVPFNGALARRLPQIPKYVDEQAANRQCSPSLPAKVVGEATYYNWRDCDDNSLLRFVIVRNQPHGWLELPELPLQRAESTAGYVWEFFNEATYRD